MAGVSPPGKPLGGPFVPRWSWPRLGLNTEFVPFVPFVAVVLLLQRCELLRRPLGELLPARLWAFGYALATGKKKLTPVFLVTCR